ncbi:hypothetical protein GCM10009799_17240 [Nocardiopsis rhodophaea]|uniref:Uncharacterized protein n=1 Tax=Nocardiopsis rhodophaea TaxID=280238 RepID=A0ABN2SSP2_9ACTN
MRPSTHLVFGTATAAMAASVLAVELPYYAIAATGLQIVLLGTWLTLVVRAARAANSQR